MKRKLYDAKNARQLALDAAGAALSSGDQAGYDAEMKKVEALNKTIGDIEKYLDEQQRSFAGGAVPPLEVPDQKGKTPETLSALLSSKEYKQAWGEAVVKGYSLDSGRAVEQFAPLYKALSLSGGATPGEDGGFLAPKDFELKVQEYAKEYMDLSTLVNVEHVKAMSGWRNVATSGTATPLPKIGELQPIGATAKPAFARVNFACESYGDRLLVSKELLMDVDALIDYLAKWWALRLVLTYNKMVLDLVKEQDFVAIEGATDVEKVKALKHALNIGLNTAHSKAAKILTNQSGYDEMDNWVDNTGRAILVPDLKGDFDRIKGRPVHYCDDDLLEAVTIGEGEDEASYNPLVIGDFKSFATLFIREGIVLDATNVGGDAWAKNGIEFRVICYMDIQTVDPAAVLFAGFEVA